MTRRQGHKENLRRVTKGAKGKKESYVEAEAIPAVVSGRAAAICVCYRLNREVVGWVRRPDIKERLFVAGAEVIASSPQELAAVMQAGMARWGKVIKEAGIRGA